MNKENRFVILAFLILLFVLACNPERPLQVDTDVYKSIMVMDTTGLYSFSSPGEKMPVAGASVFLNSKEYIQSYQLTTDENGMVEISDIIASNYEVNAQYHLENGTVLTGGKTIPIVGHADQADTLYLKPIFQTALLINEIYYCGPENNHFFFYDQYIEIVNRTDTLAYLDGKILARCRMSAEIRPYIDSLDYVQTVYTYQFPGQPGEKNYPVLPGQRVVVASDAYNHTKTQSNAINLENADFEFQNQYSADYDNPNVPNLSNLNSTKGADFLINLSSDGIVFSDGTDWELATVGSEYGDKIYINLPISTIIDGIEYKSSTSTLKGLTFRVDAGFAGLGITKYSGKSVQRINPYNDTNNSSIDFENLDLPTPGY